MNLNPNQNMSDQNASNNNISSYKKYYQSNKGSYEGKFQPKYYGNPSNSNHNNNPANFPLKPNYYSQDSSAQMFYKNNYYQHMGKMGYFNNQNSSKMYSSAIQPLGNNPHKGKIHQNNNTFNEDEYETTKNTAGNLKRKNASGIEEFENIFLKKIKSENIGNEDKRVGHFSSDYVWMGNESPVKPEKNYSQDDLPEISKKIEKLIQEVKQDVLSDDLENNFMTSFALNTLNPKLEFIGDNPAITEKTIKNFKEKLQTKPEAFDPYLINEKNEMNVEMPTRIITVPRNLIWIKEYEEKLENLEEMAKSQIKMLNEENKNIVKYYYCYEKAKIQNKSLLENINF